MKGNFFTPEDLMNIWNANCGDLPKCNDLGIRDRARRAKELLVRLSVATGVPNLGRVADAVKRAARSPFLTGQKVSGSTQDGFIASFDWFLKADSLTLIEEGQFDPPKMVVAPAPPPSTEVTGYWGTEKPDRWEPSPEEFLRCQIQGRLLLARERRTHRKTSAFEMGNRWMTDGGPHPWATEEEVAVTKREVMEGRASGSLPSSVDDFKARIPATPVAQREVTNAEVEAKPATEYAEDDPW